YKNQIPKMSLYNAQQMQYRGRKTNDYSSNLDTYSNNTFECESDNCSNYESDIKTSIIESSIFQLSNIEKQIFNSTYLTNQVDSTCSSYSLTVFTKRQEKINDKFTQKDLLNKIHKIAFLSTRDILNNKGSLKDIHLEELADKLVIQVEQGKYKKFSVIDDISEVYRVSRVHECINRQQALRPVINIDALLGDIEAEKVKTKDVFIQICVFFVRVLYIILDCSWEEIFKKLVIATLSNNNKCSYYLLYTPTLLIDYLELKEFTELIYKLTGKKYDKFIDIELSSRNFNLRLISSAKNDCVKRIL
ncbi:11717_t:CDS:2, partial [Cetraspora pellucida]